MTRLLEPAPSKLDKTAFVARFGHLYEHSPWVAGSAFDSGLDETHDTEDGLHALLSQAMMAADHDQQLALIKAHPDLAGRAAIAGELTAESTIEQSSAGLDQCTLQEYARLQSLNAHYQSRFGFPFILAVKGLDVRQILASFEQRLNNTLEAEFGTALEQINKIARLRLQDL